jgi:hypothetical protein
VPVRRWLGGAASLAGSATDRVCVFLSTAAAFEQAANIVRADTADFARRRAACSAGWWSLTPLRRVRGSVAVFDAKRALKPPHGTGLEKTTAFTGITRPIVVQNHP